MREFEGLSYREIGDRLGLSRPAVESTLFRARKRLSEEYEQLVSGERCRLVQRTVDASRGIDGAGMREQRRIARHLAHCQPCRRYARLAGADLGELAKVGRARAAAARIAALLPMPAFLRAAGTTATASAPAARRARGAAGRPVVDPGRRHVDPGTVTGWTKAVATAATVAVAGVGAGSAIGDTRGRPGAGRPRIARRARGRRGERRLGDGDAGDVRCAADLRRACTAAGRARRPRCGPSGRYAHGRGRDGERRVPCAGCRARPGVPHGARGSRARRRSARPVGRRAGELAARSRHRRSRGAVERPARRRRGSPGPDSATGPRPR